MEPILDDDQRELEKALMHAGRDVGMSPELRVKTLAALGVGAAGVATTVGAKAGMLGWLTTKAGAIWTTGVIGVLGVTGALTFWSENSTENSGSAASGSMHDASRVQTEEGETPTTIGENVHGPDLGRSTSQAVELKDIAELPEDSTDAPTQKVRQLSPKSSGSSLKNELDHLARVESALKSGKQAQALALLNEYRTKFPHRQLGLEAEVLTIQAMYESGSVAAARARAQRFLEKYPRSPLGARAKQYLRE